MKVEENLDHLIEYERYCWLMKRYRSKATKEYNYFRDGDYHYECISSIWAIMLFLLIAMLVCIPVAPYVGTLGATIVVIVGFLALSADRRVDRFKRRKFFEKNNVPNFEEYDEQPIPEYITIDRLRYMVYKFKFEKGYNMWRDHVDEYRSYPIYPIEYYANIE